jgi:hypothetical protein
MTVRTQRSLICEIGKTGAHIHSEDNQPYSAVWNSYSLEGYSGGGPNPDDLTTIFCPKCGHTGKVRYAYPISPVRRRALLQFD